MTINICNTTGLLGKVELNPDKTIIGKSSISSDKIKIKVTISEPDPEFEVVGNVTIRDQNGNEVDGIEFNIENAANFAITKNIIDSSFSFSFFGNKKLTEIPFKITKTKKFNSSIDLSITVDLVSSQLGSSIGLLTILADSTQLDSPGTSGNSRGGSGGNSTNNSGTNSNGLGTGKATLTESGAQFKNDNIGSDVSTSSKDGKLFSSDSKNTIFKPSINGIYNFYINNYERIIGKPTIPESLIPNINLMNLKFKTLDKKIDLLKTFNNIINGKQEENLGTTKVIKKINKDFFSEYVSDLENNESFFTNQQFLTSNKNFLFTNTYKKDIQKEIEDHLNLYPMHVEMNFYLDKTRVQFNSFLQEIGMIDYFYYCFLDYIKTNNKINYNVFFNTYFSENSTVYPLINVFTDTNIFLGPLLNITKFQGSVSSNFVKSISSRILNSKTTQDPELLKDEVLLYEVEKLKDNVLISKYYFINTFEDENLNFFDTQVKYDTKYKYRLNKYVFSSGINRIINIEKMFVTEFDVKILDYPPINPDISFVQYKGDPKSLLLNMNAGTGRYEDYAVSILSSDTDVIKNTAQHQNRKETDKLIFRNDDIISEFEIFRLEKPPVKFEDFKDGKIIYVSTEISPNTKTNSASVLDEIQPNKKYYYIVRAKDIHGNFSNPTNPIEIEMINENNTIFLRKREYIFKEIPKSVTKNLKRFIEIKASQNQAFLNETSLKSADSAFDVNPVLLSNEDLTLWNKTFLMRITSKTTGKKSDIKFRFNYTQPPIRERKPKS